MNNDNNNKVIIVTGGSSGIGLELVKVLLQQQQNKQQFKVVVLDLVESIELKGLPNYHFYKCNVLQEDELKRIKDLILQKYSSNNDNDNIYAVINNAGITSASNNYSKVVGVNLSAVVLVTELFQSITTIIINVSSMSAIYPLSLDSVYTATKSGVLSYSRCFTPKQSDVKVFCICPLFVMTPLIISNSGPLLELISSGRLKQCSMDSVLRAFMLCLDYDQNGLKSGDVLCVLEDGVYKLDYKKIDYKGAMSRL